MEQSHVINKYTHEYLLQIATQLIGYLLISEGSELYNPLPQHTLEMCNNIANLYM